jgi:CheY-like chemotaxis protein
MKSRLHILIAEDNAEEIRLLDQAFKKVNVAYYHIVHDGTEVVDYLQGKGRYSDTQKFVRPNCLIIDLDMPRMNGFEVLKWMKENPRDAIIPTLVITSKPTPATVKTAYDMGAQTVFARPVTPEQTVELLETLGTYWVRALFREDPRKLPAEG